MPMINRASWSGTRTYVDSLLIRRADRENIGVPMSSSKFSNDTYEGGYVHTMDPGLFDRVLIGSG